MFKTNQKKETKMIIDKNIYTLTFKLKNNTVVFIDHTIKSAYQNFLYDYFDKIDNLETVDIWHKGQHQKYFKANDFFNYIHA